MKQLVKRGLQLVGLVTGGLLAALAVGFYADHREHPLMPAPRWFGWALYTAIIATLVVANQRRRWRETRFWLVLVGLFCAHTLLYAIAFHRVSEWRILWFVPITIIEYVSFMEILDWSKRLGKG